MQAVAKAAETVNSNTLRVMVVDDSAVIRGLLRRILDADPDITVVSSVGNGQFAVDTLRRQPADVIVLDIEMPVMDGLTALPKLLEIDPDVKVIMASTLTLRNADVSLKALHAGAADYIAKPTSKTELHGSDSFGRELAGKVKALGGARRGKSPARVATSGVPSEVKPATGKTENAASTPPIGGAIQLRAPSKATPRLLAIGSSTGGPNALQTLVSGLTGAMDLPILITQHMPPTFTKILAEHLAKAGNRPAGEAKDGESIQCGRIYVAPGDYHMVVESNGTDAVLRLNKEPAENFCRPAVDPMLRSVAKIYGPGALAVILTGMGHDGMNGAGAVVEAGGTVLAQDEATSVVWGMPGAAATAGLCSAVIPLPTIASKILAIVKGS